jgi:hypothetical protein
MPESTSVATRSTKPFPSDPYDMRRTGITNLLQLPEVSIETCKAIAGHLSDEIIKTYSHLKIDAKWDALDALMRSTKAG